MKQVSFSARALSDVDQILGYFDDTSLEAARKFHNQLNLVLRQLQDWPRSGVEVLPGIRRVLVPGYSYGVFYNNWETIHVVTVMDLRRSPESIDNALL